MPTPKSPGVPERGELSDPEVHALLRLRALPGIGDVRGRELLERCGSPRRALEEALRVAGAVPPSLDGWVTRAQDTIARLRIAVIPFTDAHYPERLNQLHDRPLVLFARGDLALTQRPGAAIVGTRAATEHGLDAAHALAAGVARAGVPVVSGMARGIDTAAHRAALAVEGPTIAVLGAGIDVPYPPQNAALHEEIAKRGLLVSEFLPGTPPARANFVRRNRIIAALARVVVVVEAPTRSGAHSTVEHALDLGRDVLAVPGPVGRTSCAGTNELLRDGAAVALDAGDVLDALGRNRRAHAVARGAPERIRDERDERREALRTRPPPVDPAEAALWSVLGWDSDLHVDAAAARAGVNAGAAAAALARLEIEGRVVRSAGMCFRRTG